MVTRHATRKPVIEVRVRGVLYLRIDRLPKWLVHIITLPGSALAGWLIATHHWLVGR